MSFHFVIVIIRQRGRRRIALNWSPEKTPTFGNPLRTPTKSTSMMTLRSSPRKRLYGSDRPTGSTSASSYSPQSKRSRVATTPIAQINTKTPLSKLLKGLTSSQLINIIQNAVNTDSELEDKIRANLPTPDIRPMEEQLIILKKNIFKSLPTSRLMKTTDSIAHSRVVTHLVAFKKLIVDQSRQLNESENWDALLDYSLLAWNYVQYTPIWENSSQNAMRRSCFKILSWHCLCAIQSGGAFLGEQRLNDFYSEIPNMRNDCEDIGQCVPHLKGLLDKIHLASSSSTI